MKKDSKNNDKPKRKRTIRNGARINSKQTTKTKKLAAGRKESWTPKIQPRLLEIAAWCRDGHTEKSICQALGISAETFNKYKRLKPELLDALKVNKEIADITVENSLYKRAIGYEYEETTQEIQKDKDGNITKRNLKKIKKEVSPDTKAIERWLMNRKPETWRIVKAVEISGPDRGPVQNVIKTIMTTQEIEDELKDRGIPIPDTGGERI